MEDISDVSLVPLRSNQYLKPLTILYNINGKSKCWDLMVSHAAVSIILFNRSRRVLIFVKQFRPSVYIESIPKEDRTGPIDCDKYPASLGVTLELCAGIIDKNKSLEDIATEEIFEECGYKVDPQSLEFVCSFPFTTTRSGSQSNLYYCEVTDDMKVAAGGGIESEMIDIVEMTIEDVKSYISQKVVVSPPALLFAVQWFLINKLKL